MKNQDLRIGDEIIREVVEGEQYTVRPTDDYFKGDDGTPYEIVISHNGEEWTIFARMFSDTVETEEILSPEQYREMLPAIIAHFQRWEAVDFGYTTTIKGDFFEAEINLHVGHGIPGHGFDGVQGFADIVIKGGNVIPQRLLFLKCSDTMGTVVGEFNDLEGNVGPSWDIDNRIDLIDPATMDTGDERNDDIMMAFLAAYIIGICYEDELNAAREEGFCNGS